MHFCYNDSLYHCLHLVYDTLTGLLQMTAEPPLSDAAYFRPLPWHGMARHCPCQLSDYRLLKKKLVLELVFV